MQYEFEFIACVKIGNFKRCDLNKIANRLLVKKNSYRERFILHISLILKFNEFNWSLKAGLDFKSVIILHKDNRLTR